MRTSGKQIPVQQVFSEVHKARTSWVRTIPPRPPKQSPQSDPRSFWKPPPWSKAKVNFNGAVLKALQFARDIKLSSIILKGDSKITIDGLKSANSFLNEYGHLLVEAKEVAEQMEVVEFQHLPRQANKSAHNIARHHSCEIRTGPDGPTRLLVTRAPVRFFSE
nr:hypothetical protein CFP56_29097 [Quercus suber]